jgi:hypothetical protein
MSNNRWAFPVTAVIALLVLVGLLFQTQQLSTTQTDLNAARESIAQLEGEATQLGDELIAQATAAAATEVALLDSAAATQSALQSAAATAQAQAEATQTAQANAAATQRAQAQATQSALQSAAATQAVQAAATETALVESAATAQVQAQATQSAQTDAQATLATDLAALEAQATQSAVDANATQVALLATATQSAETIAGLDAQVEDSAAQIAAIEATAQAQATQIAAQPAAPSVSIDQPVAPVAVSSLYMYEPFDINGGNYWYEGNPDGEGNLAVDDGVYRFTYTTSRPEYGLVGSALNITEVDTLLEYQFRILDCDSQHDTTYVETIFYSEYGFAIFCNRVAWSLIRFGENGENLGYSLFNIDDPIFSQWHTLSLWIKSGEITFFLDGVELVTEETPRNAEGSTFVRFYSEDRGAVEFDNIRMWVATGSRTTGQLVPVNPDATPPPQSADTTETAGLEAELAVMTARFPDSFTIGRDDWELVNVGEIFPWSDGMMAVGVELRDSRDETAVVLLTAFDSPQDASAFWETASADLRSNTETKSLGDFPDSVRLGVFDSNYVALWWEQTHYTSITLYSQDESTPRRLEALARWVRENIMTP